MIKKALCWCKAYPKSTLAVIIVFMVSVLNLWAFMHAHSMTHFVDKGHKTPSPEAMSGFDKVTTLIAGVRIPRPRSHKTPASFGLQFEVHRSDGWNGTCIEAWHIPCRDSQELCILFHGYTECKSDLIAKANVFHNLGYHALLVDFRGSGGSSGQETTVGFREAEDVVATVKYARERISDVSPTLYGRSMGIAAILRAIATSVIETNSVILECPFDRLLTTVRNRFSAMGIPSFPCAELLVFLGGVQHGYSGFTHNPVESAKGVKCPVLLLHGARDSRVTTEQAEAIFQNLHSPKTLVQLENMGHEPLLAANTD